MPRYDFGEGRVVDVGGKPVLRLMAIGAAVFVLVVVLFASIARVPAGHVGVLTLFGRVTGQVLGEGIHNRATRAQERGEQGAINAVDSCDDQPQSQPAEYEGAQWAGNKP